LIQYYQKEGEEEKVRSRGCKGWVDRKGVGLFWKERRQRNDSEKGKSKSKAQESRGQREWSKASFQ